MFARHVFERHLKKRKSIAAGGHSATTAHDITSCHVLPFEDAQGSGKVSAVSGHTMDFSQPFSILNERLKPHTSASEQLHSSLNRLEDRELASLRRRNLSNRPTVLPSQSQASVTSGDQTDPGSDDFDEDGSDYCLPHTTCLLSELKLKDFGDDSSSTKSDEKDGGGELSSDGDSATQTPDGESSLQRNLVDCGLPDLIKSGRPLSRRRTVGHVSETLKEVRREVELSRRRSIKIKAQVDKLNERRDGAAWSQDRGRVTEEVLSILRLLHPLLESGQKMVEPPEGEKRLDHALHQLQNVARTLAVSHTAKQEIRSGKKTSEESAILQQALRDRDEAIEKKKAMEAELLRSRTEMMFLNNQVLEAAQKRLEMSLEVEAWKEDFQLLLHQQVQSQQQAEQAQKKTARLGILRRSRAPIQRPTNFPLNSTPTQAAAGSNHSSSSRASTPSAAGPPAPNSPAINNQRHWMDKLRRSKPSRQGDQEPSGHVEEGFQVISLD